jgi:PAS domain S-box-containing protein
MKTELYAAERKVAEQALMVSEQRYQSLLASTTDYVYTVTMDRGRSVATAHGPGCEAVTGFTSREFDADASLWYRMIHAEDRPAVLAQVARIVNGEAPRPLEHRIIHKDGDVRWIRNVPVPQRDPQGRMISYNGLISDITDRKHAEEQLRRAYEELAQSDESLKATLQELKATHEELKATELQLIQAAKLECIGTLAAGVAHEVKNPLQTMLMGLHYLAHNLPSDHEGIALALHDMRDAVTRANGILRGLLELAADTKSEMKAEDLNACIERSLELLHYDLVATLTTVVRQLAVDLPLVPMDRGKTEQVLINLFINALHAMSHGGTLTVTTRAIPWSENLASQERLFRQFKPGDTLVVTEVQDTGTGIPENLLPKIFDPFFTTKPVGHGTGLGLAVVKKIVDLHGGTIDIRNVSPGGVRVTLVLKGEKTP